MTADTTTAADAAAPIDIIHLPHLDELRGQGKLDLAAIRRRDSTVSRALSTDDEDEDDEDDRDAERKTPRDRLESITSVASVTSTTEATQIVRALVGLTGTTSGKTDDPDAGWVVPGEKGPNGYDDEDRAWRYRRWMPTMVLYDEIGLRIYDKITEEASEYYLYNAELELFKQHGQEIAQAMGFPAAGQDDAKSQGEVARGWHVVELGAGSLKKTSHLLLALASTIPSGQATPAIAYHPLDLSRPELVRTLEQLRDAIGKQLDGKIECRGLWGDYDRGIEFIKRGGLAKNEGSTMTTNSGGESPLPGTPREGLGSRTPLQTPPMSETSSTSDGFLGASNTSRTGKIAPPTNDADGNASNGDQDRPLHLLFLGSSLGNFDRASAVPFLSSLPLRAGKGDTLLLGLDGRPAAQGVTADGQPDYSQGKAQVERAYNDAKGITRDFIMHGLEVADAELRGLSLEQAQARKNENIIIDGRKWDYAARYNVKMGRHEAYYRSTEDQVIHMDNDDTHSPKIKIDKGELLNIEWSYKYSMSEALDLFEQSGLRLIQSWKAPGSQYHLYLLERPPFVFPLLPVLPDPGVADAAGGSIVGKPAPERKGKWKCVPTKAEWLEQWKFWDTVTLGMIPDSLLHQKPIDLRHKCLFYLGHIPTFLDIHLTRILKGKHTEPENYKFIFERGIDPHVDDPTKIHDHSEVPEKDEDWPTCSDILDYRDRVRARLLKVYNDVDSGELKMTRRMGRVLFMVFEHEAMHAETLLYMLLQSPLTLPPPGFANPHWQSLARQWSETAESSKIIKIDATIVTLGHNDKESEDHLYEEWDGHGHEFGWDCEAAEQQVSVKAFKVESLPVTNREYLSYMEANGLKDVPASWRAQPSGPQQVKTIYGAVNFDVAQHWPLMASGEELAAYARWKGGRLPTEAELMALWTKEDGPRPAGRRSNVGLQRWHPVPPTNTIVDSDGHWLNGHNGGVWEWTSSELVGLQGYEQSEVYPGFSSDFFDGLHNVVMGGSFATIPRLAARSSWRNFYQMRYPYAWIGGRVAYDL